MIITLARKCGCGGDEIGHALEEIYGIPFYDRRVISEIAKGKGLYERYPDFYGEVPMDTLLYTISQEENQSVFYDTPKKALGGLIGGENCIILGRCGNFALRDRKDKISVFLTGDDEERTDLIAEKHGISKRKASNLVEETDRRRSAYHKYYTGEIWGMAENYDLCLNVTDIGIKGVLAVIEAYREQAKI